MANEEIIGVKFNVDVSNFSKGLKQVNSYIQQSNSEFKKASAGLDDWANDTEAVTAKIKNLQEVLQLQNTKVELYRKKLDELKNSTGDNSKQITYYTTQLNKAEAQVKETKAQLDKYETSLNETEQEQEDVSQSISKMSDGFTVAKGVIANLVADGIRKLITGLKDVAVSAFNAGVEFESAFAGVKKTIDATEEEYAELEEMIIEMSKTLPASASEIAKVAELAGQLGIKKDDIAAFTKVIIDLGESTNLSAEDAASSLAKFANIMGTASQDYDRLGSVIVDLGNNFATTEADIVEMAMRIAGAGKTIGFTEAQVLSVATALSSVGIEAEMGGSAISKAMIKMENAVVMGGDKLNDVLQKTGMSLRDLELMAANDSKSFKEVAQSIGMTSTEVKQLITAGANLEDFAKISGMSAEEFQKSWGQDSAQALLNFIQKLGNTEEAGENAIAMLTEMGFTEVRLRDTLLRASNASEVFNGSLELGNKAWQENNALTEEANKRYATTESKIAMMKNQITAFGLDIYSKFKEPVGKAVSGVSKVFKDLEKDVGNGKLGKSIDKIAEAFGEFIEHAAQFISKWLKKLINGLTTLIDNWDKIGPVIKGAVTALVLFKVATSDIVTGSVSFISAIAKIAKQMLAQKTVTEAVTVAQKGLNAAMKANLIGLAIGLVGGLITLMSNLAKTTYEASESQENLNEKLSEQEERFSKITEEIEANNEARKQLREEQKKSIEEGLSEIEYVKGLKGELSELVDSNGRVKEGYESRVDFILGQLNDALGTEMSLTDGVIANYDKQMQKIDELIEKEKAYIIWKAKQPAYEAAVAEESQRKEDWVNAMNKQTELEATMKEADANYESSLEGLKDVVRQRKEANYANGTDFEDVLSKIVIDAEGNYDAEATKKNIGWLGIGGWSFIENEVRAVGEAMGSQKKVANDLEQANKDLETSNYALADAEKMLAEYERDAEDIRNGNYKAIIDRNKLLVSAHKDMNNVQLKEVSQYQSNYSKILQDGLDEALKKEDKYYIDRYNKRIEENNKELQNTMDFLKAQTSTLEENSPDVIQAWADLASNSSEQFMDYLATLNPELQRTVIGMVDGLKENGPEVAEAMRLLSEGTYNEFTKYISTLDPTLQTQIISMMNGITEKSPDIQEAMRLLSLGSYEQFNQYVSKLTPEMQEELAAVLTTIEDNDPMLRLLAENLGLGIAEGFDKEDEASYSAEKVLAAVQKKLEKDTTVETEAGKVGEKAIKAMDKSEEAEGVGKNMVGCTTKGIQNEQKQQEAVNAAGSFASRLLKKFNISFDIHSPSKKTETMGKFLIAGIAQGIRKNVNLAVKEAGVAGEEILDSFNAEQLQTTLASEMNMARSSLNSSLNGGSAVQGNNKIINFTQNNYSPKQLSRLDIYRQSKNAVSVLGGA